MTPGAFSNALKGIGGEFELTRVVGGAGAFVFIAGAVGFTAWAMSKGGDFDLTAWCMAFPGGLAAILVAIGGGAGLKDRLVASAKATESKTRTDAAAADALVTSPPPAPDLTLAPGQTATIATEGKPDG